MPRIHQTSLWQLQVPDGWEVEGNNDLVSLFKPDGVGILRILSAAEESAADTLKGGAFHGHLAGSVRTTAEGSTFSRTWTLSCRGQKLFATYRCATKNAELELAEVDELVQSISEVGHGEP